MVVERIPLGLHHPKIHLDFYCWWQDLDEKGRKDLYNWPAHDVAMFAWSRSRETLKEQMEGKVD